MSDLDTVLATIDAVTAPACALCTGPMDVSPSDWFCSQSCQERWYEYRSIALERYEEPVDLEVHVSNSAWFGDERQEGLISFRPDDAETGQFPLLAAEVMEARAWLDARLQDGVVTRARRIERRGQGRIYGSEVVGPVTAVIHDGDHSELVTVTPYDEGMGDVLTLVFGRPLSPQHRTSTYAVVATETWLPFQTYTVGPVKPPDRAPQLPDLPAVEASGWFGYDDTGAPAPLPASEDWFQRDRTPKTRGVTTLATAGGTWRVTATPNRVTVHTVGAGARRALHNAGPDRHGRAPRRIDARRSR